MPFNPDLFIPDQIDPAVQQARDREGLKIVQSEPATDYNAREIARRTKSLGSAPAAPVAFDHSKFVPDDETAPAPVKATDPAKAATPNSWVAEHLGDAVAGLQGIGRGFTAGASIYPQAVFNRLGTQASNFMDRPNETPAQQRAAEASNTWANALAEARQQNADIAAAHPLSYGGGQLVGAGTLGAATGGTSLASLAGSGALAGGVQGYTQNAGTDQSSWQDVKDAATGAGIGGALGTVGKLIPMARTALARQGESAALPGLTGKLFGSAAGRTFAPPKASDAILQQLMETGKVGEVMTRMSQPQRQALRDLALKSGVAQTGSKLISSTPSLLGNSLLYGAGGGAIGGTVGALTPGRSALDDAKSGAIIGAGVGGMSSLKTLIGQYGAAVAAKTANAIPKTTGGALAGAGRQEAVPMAVGSPSRWTYSEFLNRYEGADSADAKAAVKNEFARQQLPAGQTAGDDDLPYSSPL